jgi:hypothetical protein
VLLKELIHDWPGIRKFAHRRKQEFFLSLKMGDQLALEESHCLVGLCLKPFTLVVVLDQSPMDPKAQH